MKKFDAIIIGTGQAGPSLSAGLASAGMKVAVVERKLFGGTCVNTGNAYPSNSIRADTSYARRSQTVELNFYTWKFVTQRFPAVDRSFSFFCSPGLHFLECLGRRLWLRILSAFFYCF